MVSLAADKIGQRHSLGGQIALEPVLSDDQHISLILGSGRQVGHDQLIAVVPGGAA